MEGIERIRSLTILLDNKNMMDVNSKFLRQSCALFYMLSNNLVFNTNGSNDFIAKLTNLKDDDFEKCKNEELYCIYTKTGFKSITETDKIISYLRFAFIAKKFNLLELNYQIISAICLMRTYVRYKKFRLVNELNQTIRTNFAQEQSNYTILNFSKQPSEFNERFKREIMPQLKHNVIKIAKRMFAITLVSEYDVNFV